MPPENVRTKIKTGFSDEHVLIVDDEPNVALYLSEALEGADHDYQVSIAQTGEEALEIMEESTVDLLVTDLRMPGISGLELIRWVRASSPNTRTILITAYGDDEVEAEARRLEAYRYLTKPFDIGDFRQAVQEALQDIIISQAGFTILSDETFEKITQELEQLRHNINAHSIILADMQGQRVAVEGVTPEVDVATLLSLLAGSLSIEDELSRYFGSGRTGTPNYHQGATFEIYWTSMSADFFLVIIYNQQVQRSRMGMVQLYTRRTVESLDSILAAAETAEPPQPLDADFGASLMRELDTLFDAATAELSPQDETRDTPTGDGKGIEFLTFEETLHQKKTNGNTKKAPKLNQDLLGLEEAITQGIVSLEFTEEKGNGQ